MKRTILVCDDNPAILTAMQYPLAGSFEHILTLSKPDEILRTMAAEPVDIVLMDMNFSLGANSGREGMHWLQVLRQTHPDVPVVMLTAYGDVPLAVRALKSGAADFITKPWDNDELISKLLNVLEAQQQLAPLDQVEMNMRLEQQLCHALALWFARGGIGLVSAAHDLRPPRAAHAEAFKGLIRFFRVYAQFVHGCRPLSRKFGND